MVESIARFLDCLHAAGLGQLKHELIADGRIHRYRTAGDKAGSLWGWYVIRGAPILHGCFGSFRSGETHTWRDPQARKIDWTERRQLHLDVWRMRQQRGQIQLEVWAEVRAKAEKLWHASRPASPVHRHLAENGIKGPWGIRQLRGNLLVPARLDGVTHTLQLIAPDGAERFLSAGRLIRCYFAIGRPAGTIVITRDYATAARAYERTGHAVAVAFISENLIPVARRLCLRFPRQKLVIVAGNQEGELAKAWDVQAERAAFMVGGQIVGPELFKTRAS